MERSLRYICHAFGAIKSEAAHAAQLCQLLMFIQRLLQAFEHHRFAVLQILDLPTQLLQVIVCLGLFRLALFLRDQLGQLIVEEFGLLQVALFLTHHLGLMVVDGHVSQLLLLRLLIHNLSLQFLALAVSLEG